MSALSFHSFFSTSCLFSQFSVYVCACMCSVCVYKSERFYMVSVWLPVPVSLLFFFFYTLPISSTYNLHIYEVMCVTLSYIILYYLIQEIMHLWNFCSNIFLLTLEIIMSFAINKNIILHSFFCRLSPDQDTGKVTQHIEFDAYDVNEFEYKLNVWVPFFGMKASSDVKIIS